MRVEVVEGNLLDQEVEVIVNAWNRNLFPWWVLIPQGVLGEIKRRGGTAPFRELRHAGVRALGGAVFTGAGTLPFRGIIHFAGIGFDWRASVRSIQLSVCNALSLAAQHGFRTIAFPLIGAGTGGFHSAPVEQLMLDALRMAAFDGETRLVRYRSHTHRSGALHHGL